MCSWLTGSNSLHRYDSIMSFGTDDTNTDTDTVYESDDDDDRLQRQCVWSFLPPGGVCIVSSSHAFVFCRTDNRCSIVQPASVYLLRALCVVVDPVFHECC